jgi:Rps23 Pro-64 3,4-dihydroxylase Tpa1-like proline 4-hydroxylase
MTEKFSINPPFNAIHFGDTATETLKNEFQAGKPYKYIVLDNFLIEDFANQIYDNFPPAEALNKHYAGLNENKSEGSNFQDFHPAFSRLKEALMNQEFARWMAEVTGIAGVFVTDDNLGTGLHEGKKGSFLDIHIDFNIHVEKNVHRRLNLLIYMNKNWLPEYKGELEMWNANMTACDKKIEPIFNRCVVFETNEISYHGYGKTNFPDGMNRKSIYTYFYTVLEEGNRMKYHDTVFKPRPDDSTTKKIATNTKEALKNFIKSQFKRFGIKL